ncbi:MAG: hypothetical protein V2A71_07060 [Candidatus Eisenbacteria bacterium]
MERGKKMKRAYVRRAAVLRLAVASALALAFVLALTGCEGPTGPTGRSGESGTAQCFTCHSEDSGLLAIEVQYENSVHATGGNFERNTPPCSGCHTHEGFLARLATGSPGTATNPSPVHCFTCHQPHTSGNFNLRTEVPVSLAMGGVFNMGRGNLCANCHQALVPSPLVAAAPDSTRITSSRWGPHHGTQADLLSGSGGYEFAGFEYENSPHTITATNGCVACHMAAPYGSQAGGHQMGLTYVYHEEEEELLGGCNVRDCHYGAVTSFNYRQAQDEIERLLEGLEFVLQTRGILDTSGAPAPGKYSEAEAGALYNFLFIEEDRSLGIHNTDYAAALLEASIAKLQAGASLRYNRFGSREVRRFTR